VILWKQYSGRKFFGFFRGFLTISCAFRQEPGGKHWKKNLKTSGRNTASTKSPELHGTGRFRAGLFDLGFDPPCFWMEYNRLSGSGCVCVEWCNPPANVELAFI